MAVGFLFAWLLTTVSRTGLPGRLFVQDPHDPLIYAPGMAMGSRLQFGQNIVPADWKYAGTLAERTSIDDKLGGYQIISLARPDGDPKAGIQGDGFVEIPCDFSGTTPIVTVYSQDGQKHRFTVDTGALKSYMSGALARTLSFGREDPTPMCLFLPDGKWIHFKAEVDRAIGVLANPSPDFPFEGILGMNALACLQLKLDFRQRKLWGRASSKPMADKLASFELGLPAAAKVQNSLVTIPIKRQTSGRFSVDVSIGDKVLPLEVDTGANLIGIAPSTVSSLTLEKVGEGQVLVQNGTKGLVKYLAPEAGLGEVSFLWPVIHEGVDPRAEIGGFGPSVLPHQRVIIDYPGLRLFAVKPTDEERVEQAAGQLISGVVRLQKDGAILDMPDIVGPSKAVLTKIQDRPTANVLADLRLLAKGDTSARSRLLALYRDLNSATGHITILQDGNEATINIGQGREPLVARPVNHYRR